MFNWMSIVVCSTIPTVKYTITITPPLAVLGNTLPFVTYYRYLPYVNEVTGSRCVSVCLFSTPWATILWTRDITVQGPLPEAPHTTTHLDIGLHYLIAGDPKLPLGSDIWWSRLGTCSNRFTRGLSPWHLVAVVEKREVRILLECFLVFSMYYSKGRRNDNIIHCITRP